MTHTNPPSSPPIWLASPLAALSFSSAGELPVRPQTTSLQEAHRIIAVVVGTKQVAFTFPFLPVRLQARALLPAVGPGVQSGARLVTGVPDELDCGETVKAARLRTRLVQVAPGTAER